MHREIPDEEKRRYAIGKLAQTALIQYMKLRNVYPEQHFNKRSHAGFKFFMLNRNEEVGKKMTEILKSAGKFINSKCLKSLRFQLFADPEKPIVRFYGISLIVV
jgi:hypothetical protein